MYYRYIYVHIDGFWRGLGERKGYEWVSETLTSVFDESEEEWSARRLEKSRDIG